MDMSESIDKLKQLNDKLNDINVTLSCPVVNEGVRVQALALQYDLFMEFIGVYEDTLNYLDSIPITDENEFQILKTKKEINKYWQEARMVI
jgi:hypothetical protein